MTPTARSLAYLRELGWTACVVEQTIRGKGILFKRDALGFGDILACGTLHGIALVQTTSGSNAAARVSKILAEPRAQDWLLSGGRVFVHSWAKRGPRGKRKTWTLRETEVTLHDFPQPPLPLPPSPAP